MATSRTVAARFAQASGYLTSTLDRMQRDLRADGLIPMGEKGRGSLYGHYEAKHLTNLIIAFLGKQPSDAAETVKLVRGLPYLNSRPLSPNKALWPLSEQNAPHIPGATFGDALDDLIEGLAKRRDRMASGSSGDDSYFQPALVGLMDVDDICEILKNENNQDPLLPHGIQFRDNPLAAELNWLMPPGEGEQVGRVDLYFKAGPYPLYAFTRVTYIGIGLISLAAELLRTNPLRKLATPHSPPGSAVPNAGQKNESAGGVPTPPAPQCDPNRAQAHGSKTLTSPETMEKREKSQPSPARGRVTSCSSRGSSRLSSNVPTPSSRRPRHHGSPENPALASFT